MAIALYAHPFSSYCQKALIAFYENGVAFDYRKLGPDTEAGDELAALWPLKRFPVLVEGDRTIIEATSIIEYLEVRHPGPAPLIPADREAAVDVRMMDRVFDNYVMTPMSRIVADSLRKEPDRDACGVAEAKAMLDQIYLWLDARMAGRDWASGDSFSLADCAAAPALFYADWAYPIPDVYTYLKNYRARLLARPAFARAVDEARPYRPFFPLGAPDRD